MKKVIKSRIILAILVLAACTYIGYLFGASSAPSQPIVTVYKTPEPVRIVASSASLESTTHPVYSYVASRNSDVFHRLNCSYVNNINDGNKVYYKSRSEADARKRPCSRCKP
ncbi:MAG: hypothetical protein MJZ85_06785 [Bacteroidales bacterium]|nr:hypothetical protein [Bacteroidales bacterium]